MSGRILEGTGGYEYLIAPVDGETAGTRGGVDSRLADYGFEDRDGFVGSGGEEVADGKFLARGGRARSKSKKKTNQK